MRLVCRMDFFSVSLLLLKSKVKVLIAMVLRSHYSQFPSFLTIANNVAKLLESLCDSPGSRRAY